MVRKLISLNSFIHGIWDKKTLYWLAMFFLVAFIWMLIYRPKPEKDNRYSIPFPKECHIELNEEDVKNKILFVIGDVHGCFDELVELLDLAEKEATGNQILPIFVGDLINKGPKNVEVLRKVRSMDAYVVRGNHEEVVLREILRQKLDESYESQFKYNWAKELTDEVISYLQELPYTISIPSFNSIIVHAGLVPEVRLEDQDFRNMVSMRNLEKHGDKLVATSKVFKEDSLEPESPPWGSVWKGPEHVYYGHDATRKLQIYARATGLDTGCVYGGELTGIFLNGPKKIISVKARKIYKQP